MKPDLSNTEAGRVRDQWKQRYEKAQQSLSEFQTDLASTRPATAFADAGVAQRAAAEIEVYQSILKVAEKQTSPGSAAIVDAVYWHGTGNLIRMGRDFPGGSPARQTAHRYMIAAWCLYLDSIPGAA